MKGEDHTHRREIPIKHCYITGLGFNGTWKHRNQISTTKYDSIHGLWQTHLEFIKNLDTGYIETIAMCILDKVTVPDCAKICINEMQYSNNIEKSPPYYNTIVIIFDKKIFGNAYIMTKTNLYFPWLGCQPLLLLYDGSASKRKKKVIN